HSKQQECDCKMNIVVLRFKCLVSFCFRIILSGPFGQKLQEKDNAGKQKNRPSAAKVIRCSKDIKMCWNTIRQIGKYKQSCQQGNNEHDPSFSVITIHHLFHSFSSFPVTSANQLITSSITDKFNS